MRTCTILALAVSLTALGSCATDIGSHVRDPVRLGPLRGVKELRWTERRRVALAGGLAVTPIPAGSVWRPVGSLPEGTVYKCEEAAFAVGSGNTCEAFLVVAASGEPAGVYLPTRQAFVPRR